MNKKELRKELELVLIKAIEEVLTKKNAFVPAKIRKTTYEASKNVAKKFYKTLNAERIIKTTKLPLKKIKAVKKASSKKEKAKSKK